MAQSSFAAGSDMRGIISSNQSTAKVFLNIEEESENMASQQEMQEI